jgi:hypothetical protein
MPPDKQDDKMKEEKREQGKEKNSGGFANGKKRVVERSVEKSAEETDCEQTYNAEKIELTDNRRARFEINHHSKGDICCRIKQRNDVIYHMVSDPPRL